MCRFKKSDIPYDPVLIILLLLFFLELTKETADIWANKWHAKELEAEHHWNTVVEVCFVGTVVTWGRKQQQGMITSKN